MARLRGDAKKLIPVLVLAATVYTVMMMQFNQELHVLMLMSQATPQQVGEEKSRPHDCK